MCLGSVLKDAAAARKNRREAAAHYAAHCAADCSAQHVAKDSYNSGEHNNKSLQKTTRDM